MSEPCFSIPALAKRFGVGRTTVHNAVVRGEVPAIRLGGLWRVRLSSIPQFVVERWTRDRGKPVVPDGSCVYFIRAENGPIKIGVSRDPLARLARLNTSSPVRLELVAARQGAELLEAEYHRRFAAHRMNGEWFNPDPDILAEIERLSASPGT